MRISDWSSDVCSSDLVGLGHVDPVAGGREADAVGRVGREDDLLARRAVDRRVVHAGAVAGALEAHAVVGEPEAAVGVEHDVVRRPQRPGGARGVEGRDLRSEEHTSELQSLMRNSYAVFCLKKTKSKNDN